MRTEPVKISEGTRPKVIIEMFQDGNGNWFASVETIYATGSSSRCTGTYTIATEALDAAAHLMMADG